MTTVCFQVLICAGRRLYLKFTFVTLGLAHALAVYFNDEDAVLEGMCGKCTFCTTGAKLEFTSQAESIPDPKKLEAILAACPERDDPRLLARMAFGITSPRLTAGKWSSSHPLFGSMVSADFNALVTAFDMECKKAGYAKNVVVTTTTQKRSYGQISYPVRTGSRDSNKRARR